MIGRIAGTLLEKNAPLILVDVQGVGYELNVPMSTLFALPSLGERVQLHTQLIVREDAHLLYGFLTQEERQTFRELVKISGIGARTALAVLSGMSADELRQAVALQESARLTRVPGIGKKTAERLLLELKGKLGDALSATGSVGVSLPGGHQNDIVQALMALGYSEKESATAAKALDPALSVNDGLRMALKQLMR